MSTLRIRLPSWIDEVRANMILHDLGHQPIDGAAGAGNELQHVGTTDFLVERPFDGFDLSTNTSHAIEQLGFFANGVGHLKLRGLLHLPPIGRLRPAQTARAENWAAAP